MITSHHSVRRFTQTMMKEQDIKKRFKRLRSFEKVCSQFHDQWSGDSFFSGHFSRFCSAVLKLELLIYTHGTTLNPAIQNGNRLVLVNPRQLNATMELLIEEIEQYEKAMKDWSEQLPENDFNEALSGVHR